MRVFFQYHSTPHASHHLDLKMTTERDLTIATKVMRYAIHMFKPTNTHHIAKSHYQYRSLDFLHRHIDGLHMCSATLFGLLILFNVNAAIEYFIAILHHRRLFPQNSQHALLEQSTFLHIHYYNLGLTPILFLTNIFYIPALPMRELRAYCPLVRNEETADNNDSLPERPASLTLNNNNISESLQICLDDTSEFLGLSEPLSSLGASRHQYNGANAFHVPNIGTHAERTYTHDSQPTVSPTAFKDQNMNESAFLRNRDTHSERVQNDFQSREGKGCYDNPLSKFDHMHNIPSQLSHDFLQKVTDVSMFSQFPPSRNSSDRVGKALWIPFQGLFTSSESARNFRKGALRFDRQPYRPPDSDPTIFLIENSRDLHARRIYEAMIRSDAAKDNPKSNAMRRWVEEPFYDSSLVEAYAHRILDAVLDQAKEGFRGWKHDDYTQDERKGEIEDTEVSCEERLANVITALEEEKTICEDVMASACQIRMFVNAPKAYAGRKLNNRIGNSKRKRMRDPPSTKTTVEREEVSRPAKTRKPPARPSARKSQPFIPTNSLPQVGERSNKTPRHPQDRTLQRPCSPTLEQLVSSPTMRNHTPTNSQFFTPTERHLSTAGLSFVQQLHIDAVSPPQPQPQLQPQANTPYIPRITSMLPTQEPNLMSPPSLSYFSASAPVTPELSPAAKDGLDYPWQQAGAGNHGQNLDPQLFNANTTDPPLLKNTWNWQDLNPSCLSPRQGQIEYDLQLFTPSPLELSEDTSLQQIWSTFPEMQAFPHDSLTDQKGQ